MLNISLSLLLFIVSMALYYANKIHRINMREKWGDCITDRGQHIEGYIFLIALDLAAIIMLIKALINETQNLISCILCIALAISYIKFHSWFKGYLRSQGEIVTSGDKFNTVRVYGIMIILSWSAFIFLMKAVFPLLE